MIFKKNIISSITYVIFHSLREDEREGLETYSTALHFLNYEVYCLSYFLKEYHIFC
jgi:hypothetical protein